jgi:hypothetical protein
MIIASFSSSSSTTLGAEEATNSLEEDVNRSWMKAVRRDCSGERDCGVHVLISAFLREQQQQQGGALRVWRATSPILLDGSKYAYFISSIDPHNRLTFNPHFIKLVRLHQEAVTCHQKDLGGGSPSSTRLRHQLDAVINDPDNVVASHPDFLTLMSDVLIAMGQHRDACRLLERAMDITVSSSVLLNNDCSTLVKLIQVHRFLQQRPVA